MESLARLIIVIFLIIQSIALLSIILSYLSLYILGLVCGLISATIAISVTKFRLESFLFWVFPIFALMFSIWMYLC